MISFSLPRTPSAVNLRIWRDSRHGRKPASDSLCRQGKSNRDVSYRTDYGCARSRAMRASVIAKERLLEEALKVADVIAGMSFSSRSDVQGSDEPRP